MSLNRRADYTGRRGSCNLTGLCVAFVAGIAGEVAASAATAAVVKLAPLEPRGQEP